MRAIRGATTADANTAAAIWDATAELLKAIVERNHLLKREIISAFFTIGPGLTEAFPATAARARLGWHQVALIDSHLLSAPDGLDRCIRVLLLVDRAAYPLTWVYQKGAKQLRSDSHDGIFVITGDEPEDD